MIELHNNYIFLPKEEKKQKNSIQESKGLYLKKRIISYITDIFGVPVKNNDEMCKEIYTYQIPLNGIDYSVVFTSIDVKGYNYLDISVNCKTIVQAVNLLEYIHYKLYTSSVEDKYIMIVSYDAISEYYCNKTYPKLNRLERNLRKLMLNLYTVNFGIEYNQITIPENLQNKVNGIIKAKGCKEKKQIERLKQYFYSMEFVDIQDLLFTKRWTSIEENNQREFLSQNKHLNQLSDEELRKAFERFSPKNDWQRLFANKIDSINNIEDLFEQIRSIRNNIAHCKFFYREQYDIFNSAVNKLNETIINAIMLVEERDFAEKNIEAFQIAMKSLEEYITQTLEALQESVKCCAEALYEIAHN